MNEARKQLVHAEYQAKQLFKAIGERGLVVSGKMESGLLEDVAELASSEFGVDTHWHKKIVRAGINTMQPYSANPPDLKIQQDDIVIVDFGPVFDGWEADYARTYVLGNDRLKLKIKADADQAWQEANAWFLKKSELTGAAFFDYLNGLAKSYGYQYGGEIGGHIVGPFPHEQPGPGNLGLDIHPDNHQDMFLKDPQGNDRNWILEIHFIDRVHGIGAYTEQLIG